MAELLRISELKTYFFTDKGVIRAVDGASLSLDKGDTLGIVGESGCGKSVTALSVLRLIPKPGRQVGGTIVFEGEDLAKLDDLEMRRIRGNKISMIFQEPMASLNPVIKVGDQVAEVIQLHQHLSKRDALEKTVQMFRLVGIPAPEARLKNYPHQMSGGMQQRVMIAMALSCNPHLMIADEPTTALDVTIQAQILALINTLKEQIGMSVILITHDLGIVAETAQHVAVMYAGNVVEYCDVVSLFEDPLHPYTRGLLNSIPMSTKGQGRKQKLRAIPGVVPNLLELPTGCRFQDRCLLRSRQCLESEPELVEHKPGHLVRCWRASADR
ncbi:MAG: ABC transporter ATP-binding protein [Deltaproteobacteria bacterium]|nr:ABC transporter ATP-binding protein [Deltaproteobacteria bacterium]